MWSNEMFLIGGIGAGAGLREIVAQGRHAQDAASG